MVNRKYINALLSNGSLSINPDGSLTSKNTINTYGNTNTNANTNSNSNSNTKVNNNVNNENDLYLLNTNNIGVEDIDRTLSLDDDNPYDL